MATTLLQSFLGAKEVQDAIKQLHEKKIECCLLQDYRKYDQHPDIFKFKIHIILLRELELETTFRKRKIIIYMNLTKNSKTVSNICIEHDEIVQKYTYLASLNSKALHKFIKNSKFNLDEENGKFTICFEHKDETIQIPL